MDMNDVLRENIHRRRKALGRSQGQVAHAMTRLTGSVWSKQLVSRLETGGRRLDMNELVLLAETLETTVAELLRPSGEVALSPHQPRFADEVFVTVAGDVADMTRRLEEVGRIAAPQELRGNVFVSRPSFPTGDVSQED